MSGYTPLFQSIITSSIWNEDDQTRIVWISLLALADAEGKVEGSIAGIAPVARVTIQQCEKALKKLRSPDPYSRTKDDEGRRIKEIDGGWLILNHNKYREKAKNRAAYFREWRQKKKVAKEEKDSNTNTNSNSATARNKRTVAQRVALSTSPEAIREDFFSHWNSTAKLPRIRSMTEKRTQRLNSRLKEPDFADNWRRIIDRIAASAFCTGQNERGWRADIDWLLSNSTNYVKVLEGKYDDKGGKPLERDAEGLTPRERYLRDKANV
jgi:hypothetical protein